MYSSSTSSDVEMMDSTETMSDDLLNRCKQFAQLTGTDNALAMIYLQDNNWDIENAINLYFERLTSTSSATMDSVNTHSIQIVNDTSNKDAIKHSSPSAIDVMNGRIRVLSWNLDGLDTSILDNRTSCAGLTIQNEDPHAIFLQEVVPFSMKMLTKIFEPLYHIFTVDSNTNKNDFNQLPKYFNMILLKKQDTQIQTNLINHFQNSTMGRHFISVFCTLKDIPFCFITSHLESTKDYSQTRKQQLQEIWSTIKSSDSNLNIIFAGDLNLRDSEVNELGGVPPGIIDVWEATGSRKEAMATWDTNRNYNAARYVPHKCQLRFDRMYLRPSQNLKQVKPVYFELTGLNKVPKNSLYASDHWGILGHFDKV